jgi:hypothetical protein
MKATAWSPAAPGFESNKAGHWRASPARASSRAARAPDTKNAAGSPQTERPRHALPLRPAGEMEAPAAVAAIGME